MGCDVGQGMLLGPPQPKEKLRQLIRMHKAQKLTHAKEVLRQLTIQVKKLSA
jgi:hypothetical protein